MKEESPLVNNAHWLAENDYALKMHKEKAKDQLYEMFFDSNKSDDYFKKLYELVTDMDDELGYALLDERKNFIQALQDDRAKRLDYLL